MVEDNGNLGNKGFLSEQRNDEGLYPIHGIAIGNNDITIGNKSGEPKLWRPSVLEEAAETLKGKDIVVNHENQDAYKKIGEIEEVKYDEERGVIYRGGIDDDELAEKIARDWLEVSPRIKHTKAHEEIQGVKVPEAIRDFDNLSVVRRGAAGSNELKLGETEELSVEELQASFDDDEDSVSEYHSIADEDTIEELQPDVDYARWMFEDREAAEGASERFGCGGSHAHEVDGETWYMPCQNHDNFLKAMGESNDDELSENDEVDNEPEEPDEVVDEELEKDEYSQGEKRMASLLSSQSELTKKESMSIVDAFSSSQKTNVVSLASMINKVLGEEEMKNLQSELEKHSDMEESSESDGRESPLNMILR